MKTYSTTLCRLLITILLVLLCGAGATQLQAQQNASTVLRGTVVDPVGSAIQGATVVVRSESSSVESKSTTDQEGKFSFSNLSAGNYTVEVSAPGFALATRR